MSFRPRDVDLTLFTAAGVQVPNTANKWLTLASGTTYYAEVGGAETHLISVMYSWNSTIVAAITVEATNFSPEDAPTWVAAGNLWALESGPGVITIPGGTTSAQMDHYMNYGGRRMRLKIVVTTGGVGQLRIRPHFKGA